MSEQVNDPVGISQSIFRGDFFRSTASFLGSMGLNKVVIKSFARDKFYRAPITFSQSTIGVSLYALRWVNIIPGRALLFHPILVTGSIFESYRCLASSLAFSGGIVSVTLQAVQSYYWKSQLEESIGTGTRISMLVDDAKGEKGIWDTLNTLVSSALMDRYLHMQLLTISLIVGQEILLYYIFGGSLHSNSEIINPEWLTKGGKKFIRANVLYPLNPVFEHSLFIIWVMRFKNMGFSLLNPIPLPTLLIPIAWIAANRFRNISVIAKAFTTAVVVSKVMDLKCHMSDEDMVDGFLASLKNFVVDFLKMFGILSR